MMQMLQHLTLNLEVRFVSGKLHIFFSFIFFVFSLGYVVFALVFVKSRVFRCAHSEMTMFRLEFYQKDIGKIQSTFYFLSFFVQN